MWNQLEVCSARSILDPSQSERRIRRFPFATMPAAVFFGLWRWTYHIKEKEKDWEGCILWIILILQICVCVWWIWCINGVAGGCRMDRLSDWYCLTARHQLPAAPWRNCAALKGWYMLYTRNTVLDSTEYFYVLLPNTSVNTFLYTLKDDLHM